MEESSTEIFGNIVYENVPSRSKSTWVPSVPLKPTAALYGSTLPPSFAALSGSQSEPGILGKTAVEQFVISRMRRAADLVIQPKEHAAQHIDLSLTLERIKSYAELLGATPADFDTGYFF